MKRSLTYGLLAAGVALVALMGAPLPWSSAPKGSIAKSAETAQILIMPKDGSALQLPLPAGVDAKTLRATLTTSDLNDLGKRSAIIDAILQSKPTLVGELTVRAAKYLCIEAPKQQGGTYLFVPETGALLSLSSSEKLSLAQLQQRLTTGQGITSLGKAEPGFYAAISKLTMSPRRRVVSDSTHALDALKSAVGFSATVSEAAVILRQEGNVPSPVLLQLLDGSTSKAVKSFIVVPAPQSESETNGGQVFAGAVGKVSAGSGLPGKTPLPSYRSCKFSNYENPPRPVCMDAERGVGHMSCSEDTDCEGMIDVRVCESGVCTLEAKERVENPAHECDKVGAACEPRKLRRCDPNTKLCTEVPLADAESWGQEVDETCDSVGQECSIHLCSSYGTCELAAPPKNGEPYTSCLNSRGEPDQNLCFHNACTPEGTCEPFAGPGDENDETCQTSEECTHYACDYSKNLDGICVLVIGRGESECSKEQPCPPKHLGCLAGQCMLVDGEGENECDVVTPQGQLRDPQCVYRRCNDGFGGSALCEEKFGSRKLHFFGRPDECDPEDPTDDCHHRTCLRSTDEEYYAPWNGPKHQAEGGPICGIMQGEGPDECPNDEFCAPPPLSTRTPAPSITVTPGAGVGYPPRYHRACRSPFDDTKPGEICRKVLNDVGLDGRQLANQPDECTDSFQCGGATPPPMTGATPAGAGSALKSKPMVTPTAAPARTAAPAAKAVSWVPKLIAPAFAADGGSEPFNPSTPVTVQVYQDFKCGMCKRTFERALKPLIANEVREGKVILQAKEFPLGFRSKEVQLAVGAKCAEKQGRYVDYITVLYDKFKEADPEQRVAYAVELDLDVIAFSVCISDPATEAQVRADYEDGERLGVRGTPTFVINGKVYPGAVDHAALMALIRKEAA